MTWPKKMASFAGAVLLVLGVALLVTEVRDRRHERHSVTSIPGVEDERGKD